MKKITSLFLITILLTSGCFKRDTMEDITIYTTAYPIEYVTNILYGDKSEIKSIYPDGVIISKYNLSPKQIIDYSNGDLFIYNGLSNEKDYAVEMLNNNNLKIIDVSLSMEYKYDQVELWMDPSNLLMISQNVKNGLKQYISNPYIEKEVEEAYDELKVSLSEIDVALTTLYSTSTSKIIISDNDALLFLEKYGFEVISLENNENFTEKKFNDAKELINAGKIKYIYSIQNTTSGTRVSDLINDTKISKLSLYSLESMTDEEREEKQDYVYKMTFNINELKKELYN